ncbi:poly(R)-hydroxyalkanoic acid synthase subunit PhaE [Adhaeribacter soli]|uniref:Poly(3-hydroxyalkanoate) polymerase subunit PhaE n=1 Tax=Adhaeribacter soli TaxID=2607655 RepID=A0A5N1JA77_9BACT|nr:poly(R)-hydroxyalkanoic acid synthase subunit PhaE [Adhaeribacter soli]KAA9345749.1 hypothetical protein F0P94_01295 [Adhaeribacter soli]
MENKNTFFDNWMEAQTKMTKNWTELNEKMQGTMLGGEMMEKGSELYKEWLENQKNLLNTFMGQPVTPADGREDKNAANNTSASSFFQNWFKMQNEVAMRMMETSRSLYENFLKTQNSFTTEHSNGQGPQNWMNAYGNFFSGLTRSMADLPKFMNPGTAKGAFESMLQSTELYNRLYQMWQPFFQQINKPGFDAENMTKMFDPAAYKAVIDQMFGFAPAQNLTQLFEQSAKYITNWYHTNRQMGDSFLNAFGKERDLLEGLMPSGTGYTTEMYRSFYNNFRQYMLPLVRMSAPGNEQQQLDAMFEIQEKLVNFGVKQTEMQYLIYTNAGKAWNEVMELLRTRHEENKEYANFQEFYGDWSAVNEKIFIELFATDEFSRLQGELISLSLDLRKGFENQMEAMLEPYPVVLRSQLEEVYRNNYELRKELRALQKTVKELQKKVETEETTEHHKAAKATARK